MIGFLAPYFSLICVTILERQRIKYLNYESLKLCPRAILLQSNMALTL